MKLLFVTQNNNKLKEIEAILPGKIKLMGLEDIAFFDDIPEPFETLHENALHKAKTIFEKFKLNCFADDTGLEVDALGGRPGVYSARYAGNEKSNADNIRKLLSELKDVEGRSARFRTVIALIENGNEILFEGIVEGKIISSPKGEKGFGYDPVFIPDGFNQTFAEMELSEKNKISHRAVAVNRLCRYLVSRI